MRRALALFALLGSLAPSASGQTMRAFSASRAAAGERMLRATLEFGAGQVVIQPGVPGELYRTNLRYDAERSAPIQEYDSRTGILRLGLETVGGGGIRVTSRARLDQSARFELSTEVPLSLVANLGAAEATIDLGGTALNTLMIRSGATSGTLTFSRPTTGHCQRATFTLGASDLEVSRLAAAGCSEIRVDGGVGRASLGFEGTWRRDVTVVAEMSMGTLTLRVPRGVGVRITAARFLTTLNVDGLVRTGDVWSTPEFSTAPQKITVELKTSMAGVKVEWLEN
ncbi:MAG: hypothetical protein V4503_01355 [Gemmatimonadota bacterium]